MSRRKVLGCAGAALLVLATAVVLFVVFILRPTLSILDDLEAISTLRDRNAEVVNQDPFEPPPDRALSTEQIKDFVRIQGQMKRDLGPTFDELDAKARVFKGMSGEGETVGFRKAVETMRGIGDLLVRAKEAQIRALNETGISWREYRWIRTTLYHSLDISGADIYFEDVAAEFASDSTRASLPEIEEPVARINRERVAAYGDSVDVWFPFLVFGL